MTNKEKYKQAFSAIHTSDGFSLEVEIMERTAKHHKFKMIAAVAAACAVWIHGKAGDIATSQSGIAGLLAGDIAAAVPAALNAINR